MERKNNQEKYSIKKNIFFLLNKMTYNTPKKEQYHFSPSSQKGRSDKKGKKSNEGVHFIKSESGYRQATKCPCPYEYPSIIHPPIPFI